MCLLPVPAEPQYQYRLRSNDARARARTQGGAVLTGHEDGAVRAWVRDGSNCWTQSDDANWKALVKMHNTAVCCLVPTQTGRVWTCSAAGSIRQIAHNGERSAVDAKAPGCKSAHSSSICAAVVTMSDTLWTGARNIRIWTSAGEWRQSLETHAGRVTSMAVAGERVWVAFSDGRLRLFQDETAVCLVQLQNDGKHSAVTCLTPTSHCMWTGTADGHVCCFALESQRQLLMAPVSNHAVASLAATPGSIWVAGDKGLLTTLPRPAEESLVHATRLTAEDSAEINQWLARPLAERGVRSLAISRASSSSSLSLAPSGSTPAGAAPAGTMSAGANPVAVAPKAHSSRIWSLVVVPASADGATGRDGGEEGAMLWTAAKGDKNVLIWGPIVLGGEGRAGSPISGANGSSSVLVAGCQSRDRERPGEGVGDRVGGAVVQVSEEAAEISDSDSADEEDTLDEESVGDEVHGFGGSATTLKRVFTFSDHYQSAVGTLRSETPISAVVATGSAFLSGGADGSVRVWARGSAAGGGPSPVFEGGQSLSRSGYNHSGSGEMAPAQLHSVDLENRKVPEECRPMNQTSLSQTTSPSPEAGEGAVSKEEWMHLLMETTGASVQSASSFFATPEPGHDPRRGAGFEREREREIDSERRREREGEREKERERRREREIYVIFACIE